MDLPLQWPSVAPPVAFRGPPFLCAPVGVAVEREGQTKKTWLPQTCRVWDVAGWSLRGDLQPPL